MAFVCSFLKALKSLLRILSYTLTFIIAKAIRQSLNYAMPRGKKAGIVLVLNDMGDEKHLERLREMAGRYSIDVEIFSTQGVLKKLHKGFQN